MENQIIEEKLSKLSPVIKDMFHHLRKIIYDVNPTAIEKMWAGLPSYYSNGDKFIRLIPFKDHINIEASAIIDFKTELYGYRFTPKNMLSIYVGETIPETILFKVFYTTLSK